MKAKILMLLKMSLGLRMDVSSAYRGSNPPGKPEPTISHSFKIPVVPAQLYNEWKKSDSIL
ncbi:hypothetical protein ACVLD2_004523 [Paenibacillus sp. PvR052]